MSEKSKQKNKKTSGCCNAPVEVVGGDEGTNHYECSKCKRSCDVAVDVEPPKLMRPTFEELKGRGDVAECSCKQIFNLDQMKTRVQEHIELGHFDYPEVKPEGVKGEGAKPKEVLCGKCSKPKKHENERERCHCGRPMDYSEEMVERAQEYLDDCEDEEEQQLVGLSAKGTELYKTKLRVRIPSMGGLARYLKVHRSVLYIWEKEYPEFFDIMEELRAKQEEALVNNGLSGDYNSTISKVILTKHGYRDAVDNFNREVPVDPEAKKRGDDAVKNYLGEDEKK